jgi:putative hydroxymethylpyrimidine transport system substrate-binding protein
MRSRFIIVLALAAAAILVSAASAGGQKVTLTLDWTPNPDHVGFYYARDTGLFVRAGLDVSVRAPSDPTAPL